MEKNLTNLDMGFKKTAVDLTDLALGIIILGVVVSIGSVILVNYRDSRLTSLDTSTTSNETIVATDAGANLAERWVESFGTVTNATGNETITASGNYTTSISSIDGTGTITFVGSSTYNGTDVHATYDIYDLTGADWALSDNASTGVGEFGNWFTIIVIVGVASVILSLIFMAFGNRGTSSTGGSY